MLVMIQLIVSKSVHLETTVCYDKRLVQINIKPSLRGQKKQKQTDVKLSTL